MLDGSGETVGLGEGDDFLLGVALARAEDLARCLRLDDVLFFFLGVGAGVGVAVRKCLSRLKNDSRSAAPTSAPITVAATSKTTIGSFDLIPDSKH